MATSTIVLDTSALLDYVLGEANAVRVEAMLAGSLVRVHAPQLLDQELLSVARRLERAGELTERRAKQVLQDAAAIMIELHPLRPHYERVWSLRRSLWASDAYYVSLAESLGAPLVTTDAKLARAVATVKTVDIDVIVP